MKRVSSFESQNDSIKKIKFDDHVHKKVQLVVLPGASGTFAKEMTLFLSTLEANKCDVIRPQQKIHWNTRDASHKTNIELINNLTKNLDSERLFVLMGISFGNRVIAHMLEGDSSFTHRKPDGIIFGAYPLYGESDDDENNQKRRKPLFNISPNSKKIIFVSGEKDEFVNRDYMKEKGKRVLEKLIDELNKKTEEPQQKKEKLSSPQFCLKMIPLEKHSLVSKKSSHLLLEIIDQFISNLEN